MRILYIHQYFATWRGGSGTRSLEQGLAMRRAGHTVTMLTSSAQLSPQEVPPGRGKVRRGEVAGLDCVVVDVPYHQGMSYARRIVSFLSFMARACWLVLREPRPDVVFATSTPLTIGVPALVGRWLRRVPYLFEVRDLWPDLPIAMGVIRGRLPRWLLSRFERQVYTHAAALVAANQDLASVMGRRTRGDQPILVVPNACDTSRFGPDLDGSAFREAHGLEGATLAVHTGTMGPVNGLDAILDAAGMLKDLPGLKLVLIGGGNQKPRLRQRVADEGLSHVLILDSVPKAQVAQVLATADIGLMTVAPIPILEMNCANKFFDYLASGLPVILNYQGWKAKLLEDHDCGLSAAQGDTAGFAARIRALAEDPRRSRAMGQRGRALAEGALNRQRVVRPILDELAKLASCPGEGERDGGGGGARGGDDRVDGGGAAGEPVKSPAPRTDTDEHALAENGALADPPAGVSRPQTASKRPSAANPQPPDETRHG